MREVEWLGETLLQFEALANKTWERMLQLVGLHTARVLVMRALWECHQRFAEADAIRLTEQGIDLKGLFRYSEAERQQEIAEFFFLSLVGLLSRLVGPEVTATLSSEIPEVRDGA